MSTHNLGNGQAPSTEQRNWRRKFITIWVGQAFSLISSGALQLAIIWFLTQRTGSAMVLSLATLVGFLPQALLGPVIGVWVDRWPRKHVIIGADAWIALVALFLGLASLFAEPPIWLVLLALFLRSIGTAFHSPALNAITPLLVPAEQLTKAAGYTQALQSSTYILAPALGALVYGIWGLNAAIFLDVLGAVLAILAVTLVRVPELPQGGQPDATQNTGVWKEMLAGWRILKTHNGLFALIIFSTILTLIYMPVSALYPLMSFEHFQGDVAQASLVEILFAAGMLVGGLLLGAGLSFKNPIRNITWSFLVMGLSLAISGLLPPGGFPVFAAMCALTGLAAPYYGGVQTALMQERVAPEYMGRVFALIGSLASLAMPLGLILSGLLADRVGVANWFAASGALVVILGLTLRIWPSLRCL